MPFPFQYITMCVFFTSVTHSLRSPFLRTPVGEAGSGYHHRPMPYFQEHQPEEMTDSQARATCPGVFGSQQWYYDYDYDYLVALIMPKAASPCSIHSSLLPLPRPLGGVHTQMSPDPLRRPAPPQPPLAQLIRGMGRQPLAQLTRGMGLESQIDFGDALSDLLLDSSGNTGKSG